MQPLLRSFVSFGFLVAGLAIATTPAHATWPNNPALNRAVSIGPDEQGASKSIPDGVGGAFVVWQDARTGYGHHDIYAQRLDSEGNVLWATNGVPICIADSIQAYPLIVSDGAGGAIIVWADVRGPSIDSYMQRVNGAGVVQWAANGVLVCNAPGDQFVSGILSDGAGGAILAFTDTRSGNTDVYVQRVSPSGALMWLATGVPICTAAGIQNSPELVAGGGGAIVSWNDERLGFANSDIYVRAVTLAGVAQWTANGVALCTATGVQRDAHLVTDGADGAIVSWHDERTPGTSVDVYARRVSSSGVPQWTANGVAICAVAAHQYTPVLTSDGVGGAIIAWGDGRTGPSYDIFAQRVNGSGVVQWAANGVSVSAAADNQVNPVIISDGLGGALVAWEDLRLGTADLYGQRLNSAGVSQWTVNGAPLSTAIGGQGSITLSPDGNAGAIAFWTDYRSDVGDIYAQRINSQGLLGRLEPLIDDVRDVPNDQGGRVRVLWQPSVMDVGPSFRISSYTLWRRITTTAALARVSRPVDDRAPAPGSVRADPHGAESVYWEYVVEIPGRGAPGYSYMVTTGSDSMPGSVSYEVFFVEARDGVSGAFYTSAVDSGYSVDNLSPATPGPFTAHVAAGATHLHWNPNQESDLLQYRLYRGSSPGFVPGPGNRIASPPDTGYTDASTGFYYKLSAVDVHGNESPYALVAPTTTDVAINGADVSLALGSANPAHGLARLRFTLPRVMDAKLVVHDAAGRVVHVLREGACAAGEHSLAWNGTDRDGRVLGSGVYWARLSAGERSLTVRFAWLR